MTIGLERNARWRIAFGAGHLGGFSQASAAVFDPDQNPTIRATAGHVNQSFFPVKVLFANGKNKRSLAIATD